MTFHENFFRQKFSQNVINNIFKVRYNTTKANSRGYSYEEKDIITYFVTYLFWIDCTAYRQL